MSPGLIALMTTLVVERRTSERANRSTSSLNDGDPSANVHFAFQADRAFDAAGVNGHRLDRAPSIMPHIHPNFIPVFCAIRTDSWKKSPAAKQSDGLKT
jgi:hypothetical protein